MKKIILTTGALAVLLTSSSFALSTLFDTNKFAEIQNLAKSDTATEEELRSAARLMEEEAFEAEDYARRDKAILEATPFKDPIGLTYKEREDSYNSYIEAAKIRRELAATLEKKADAAFNKEEAAALEAEAAACEKEVADLKSKGTLTEEETKTIKFCEERAAELRKQAAELKAPAPASPNFKLIVPIPCLALGVEKCASASETNPLKYIATLYNFGIGIGLLVAMAVIVFAGLRWSTSAGNVAATADARDMIINAVIGVVMLLGATMILNIISPDLANLKLDALTKLENRSFEFANQKKAIDQIDNERKSQSQRRIEIDKEIANAEKAKESIPDSTLANKIARAQIELQIQGLKAEDLFLKYDNLNKRTTTADVDTALYYTEAARAAYNEWQAQLKQVAIAQAALATLLAQQAAGG